MSASPAETPDILLIGLRGSGKSTLARAMAPKLGAIPIDLDDLVAERAGHPDVGTAFRALGEPAFRTAESDAFLELIRSPAPYQRIIALGGGTPTAPRVAPEIARLRHQRSAFVVYLRLNAPALRSRLEKTDVASRPSLTGSGTLDEIEQVLAARDALYRSLADLIVEAEKLSVDGVIRAIVTGMPTSA